MPEGRHIPVYLEGDGWNITAHYIQPEGGGPVYVAVRMMCGELGVSADTQLVKLNAEYGEGSDADDGILVEMRVATPGGRQVMKCVRKAEAALWIVGITPRKVRHDLRSHLEDIRRGVLLAADRLVWGDYSGTLAVSSAPPRGALYLHCLRCQAPHKLEIAGGEVSWEIVNEE